MIGTSVFVIALVFICTIYGEMFYITNPNGHTVWKVGQSVKITWQIIPGGPAVHSINLDLMSGPDGNATTLLNIATGLSPGSTSFDWIIPHPQGAENILVNGVWVDNMMRQVGPSEWILPDEAWNKIGSQFPLHQLPFIKLTGVTDSFSTYVYNFSHRFIIKEDHHHPTMTTNCSKSSVTKTGGATTNASGMSSAAGSGTAGANATNGSNAAGGAAQTGTNGSQSQTAEGNNSTENISTATSSIASSTSTTRKSNSASNIKLDLGTIIAAVIALTLFF